MLYAADRQLDNRLNKMPAKISAKLIDQNYGKTRVRLTKVARRAGGRHDLFEFSVDTTLRGDFDRCYTHGDNGNIVATDSQRNTVYLIAHDHEFHSPEQFALILSQHFIDRYPQISGVKIEITAKPWQRILAHGVSHAHSFVGASSHLITAAVDRDRKSGLTVQSGVRELPILKTADSAFRGYVRDEYTTLKETDDRIFATNLSADWDFTNTSHDFNDINARVLQRLLDVFADHKSLAVQQTMFEMGKAVIEEIDSVERIRLTMPNKHRIPFNLAPFHRENTNEIFITTDEPSGNIYAEIGR